MKDSLASRMAWDTLALGADALRSVSVPVGVYGRDGPKVSIVAGIHGDEGPWARWAIQKFLESTGSGVWRGTLRVVSVANPTAFADNSRCSPLDSLDLNRSFPGDPKGSHTQALASALHEFAVQGADLVIDLHGGGSWCVNGFAFYFPESKELSRAVGAPFLVDASTRGLGTVSLTTSARASGSRAVAIEMGGAWRGEAAWAERIANGLRRLFAKFGALPEAYWDDGFAPSRAVGPTHVLRPQLGGIFEPAIKAEKVGHVLARGTRLGTVRHPGTWEITHTFEAPFEKTALLLARPGLSVLNAGDMSYVVAEVVGEGC